MHEESAVQSNTFKCQSIIFYTAIFLCVVVVILIIMRMLVYSMS